MSTRIYNICVLAGDGIGPEVTQSAMDVLSAAANGVDFRFHEAPSGYDSYRQTGDPLPEASLDAARTADGVLVGAFDVTAVPREAGNPLRRLRRELGVRASLRPSRSYAGVSTGRAGVDLVIVREVTEGLYSGRERTIEGGAIAERVITREASLGVAEVAFAQAQSRRGSVTAVHKRSALRLTEAVFLDAAEEVASRYPEVTLSMRAVDACALDLVQDPERFDVILTTNSFGDILSDVAAGLTGGIGLAASGCLGPRWSYFEPAHGTAPGRAGQARANPIATILCAAMMVRELGEEQIAQSIEQSVAVVLADGPRTSDLGGSAGSAAMTEAIVAALRP